MFSKKCNLFLISILICYILFISFDFSYYGNSNISAFIKYFTIILIFLFSLYSKIKIFKITLFLTLICDYLLLFTNYYFAGVFLFSIVQIIYLYYQFEIKKRQKYILSILPLPLLSIGLFYAILIATNLILSVINYRKNNCTKNVFFLLGIILFALCDISTALFNLFEILFLSQIIWIFYIPSQLLLVISSFYPSCSYFSKNN